MANDFGGITVELGMAEKYDAQGTYIGAEPDGTCWMYHSAFPDVIGRGERPNMERQAMMDLVGQLAARLVAATAERRTLNAGAGILLSDLDANDDGERMVSDGYLVRTSTEHLNQLEAAHKRTRDLVGVCLRRITDVSLSVEDLKPMVASLEATVTRWTGGQ